MGEANMTIETITVEGYSITKISGSWWESTLIPWESVRETFLWLADKFAKISPGPWVEMWLADGCKPARIVNTPDGWTEYIYNFPSREYRFRCWPPEASYSWETNAREEVYEHAWIRTVWPFAPYTWDEHQPVIPNKVLDQLKTIGTGWFCVEVPKAVAKGLKRIWVTVKKDGELLFGYDSHLFFRIVKNYTPAFQELAGLAFAGLKGVEFNRNWGEWFGNLYLIHDPLPTFGYQTVYDAALVSEKLCRQIASSPKVWEKVLTGHISYDRNLNLGFLSPENPPIAPSGKDASGNGEPTESQATLLVKRPVEIPDILNTYKDVDDYLEGKIQWPTNWNYKKRKRFLQSIIENHAPHLLPQSPGEWPRILSTELDSLILQLPDLIRQEAERKSTRPKAERKRPKKESGSTI